MPAAGPVAQTPRVAGPLSLRLAEVVRAGLPAYARAHRLPPHHWKILNALLACRTPLLGGHQEQVSVLTVDTNRWGW